MNKTLEVCHSTIFDRIRLPKYSNMCYHVRSSIDSFLTTEKAITFRTVSQKPQTSTSCVIRSYNRRNRCSHNDLISNIRLLNLLYHQRAFFTSELMMLDDISLVYFSRRVALDFCYCGDQGLFMFLKNIEPCNHFNNICYRICNPKNSIFCKN